MLTVKEGKFYLDNNEFIIRSGAFHYFRALPEYWDGILEKIKAAGLNTVETYVCWNLHEPKPGEYNFEGILDIESFIKKVHNKGLKLLLRIGPYICAEWDNGGLPAWLLKDRNIRLRCNTEPYMTYLRNYMRVIIEKIKPYLYDNGGPVIAIALENEYGSYGDDFEYLSEIEKIYNEMELNCLFFSADGDGEVFCCTGSHNHIVKGMDFSPHDGGDMEKHFDFAKIYNIENPSFAAEYWAGQFSWWGEEQRFVNKEYVKNNIKEMAEKGISFNIYMMFGGTNFGFWGGANSDTTGVLESAESIHGGKATYSADITSYDYDAPIREWGAYNESYHYIREALVKNNDIPLPNEPELQNIGKVTLEKSAALFENLHIGQHFKSKTLESMEHFGQNFGYILYKKVMSYDSPMDYIIINGLRDRAHIFLNGEPVAVRLRCKDESRIKLRKCLCKGDVLEILVENMGRVNIGPIMKTGDRKGIIDGVLVGIDDFLVKHMFDWEVTTLELNDIGSVNYKEGISQRCPAFYKGYFNASSKNVCFVHFDNFKKGVVFVNGFNLGRYWEIGPQTALYLPGVILKEKNEIVVFETDGLKGNAELIINDKPGV